MRPSRSTLFIALLVAGVVAALAWTAIATPSGFTGTTYDPPEPAADFHLVDHTGRAVTLSDYTGSAVLMFFGYTHCPDVCPITLQKLSRVMEHVDADTSELRILLVTVDPERDTPEVLADYVRRFGPHVTGLTGDPEELARMRTDYYIHAGPPAMSSAPHDGDHDQNHDHPTPAARIDISHTTMVLGVDGDGLLRVLLPMQDSEQIIARDIELLLDL